jgi:hypothetical protein
VYWETAANWAEDALANYLDEASGTQGVDVVVRGKPAPQFTLLVLNPWRMADKTALYRVGLHCPPHIYWCFTQVTISVYDDTAVQWTDDEAEDLATPPPRLCRPKHLKSPRIMLLAHEFGHALGLNHGAGVMSPVIVHGPFGSPEIYDSGRVTSLGQANWSDIACLFDRRDALYCP